MGWRKVEATSDVISFESLSARWSEKLILDLININEIAAYKAVSFEGKYVLLEKIEIQQGLHLCGDCSYLEYDDVDVSKFFPSYIPVDRIDHVPSRKEQIAIREIYFLKSDVQAIEDHKPFAIKDGARSLNNVQKMETQARCKNDDALMADQVSELKKQVKLLESQIADKNRQIEEMSAKTTANLFEADQSFAIGDRVAGV